MNIFEQKCREKTSRGNGWKSEHIAANAALLLRLALNEPRIEHFRCRVPGCGLWHCGKHNRKDVDHADNLPDRR